MPSLEPAANAGVTPSNTQLALALAIVKLKPSNTTIRDYISEIRSHIREGRQERDWHSPSNHVDSIAFWQQAYEKSESAQSQLLDRIYELERRNDALMDRVRSVGADGVQSSSKTPLKRKTNGKGGDSTIGNSWKRVKGTATRDLGNAGIGVKEPTQDMASELDHLGGDTAPFLRQLYQLQQLLQKKLNVKSLSLTAVELCKTGGKVITSVLEPNKKPSSTRTTQKTATRPAEPDVISTLRVIERSYPSLLHCLKKLSTAGEGNAGAGLVLHHIILLFKSVLNGLHLHSTATAKEAIARARPPKAKGRTKTNKTKTTQVSASADHVGDDNIARQITHLLEAMVLSLDPSIQEQCNLLEGFLFLTLDRVGKMLCLFVLGDLQSSCQLRLDPVELPLPGGLTQTQNDEITKKGAECEARHLVVILEKALAFTDQNKERMAAISTNKASTCNLFKTIEQDTVGDKSATHVVPSITERVRTKLQNTLLRAVFGDQDPSFKDSLPAPEIPESIPGPVEQDTKTDDTPEWFTREVWRLLGWEILSRANC